MTTQILWAADSDLPAGWPLLGHRHAYYHLFYIVSGQATFYLDNTPCSVSPGVCLIIPPGVYHEVPADQHTLMESREIKFSLHNPVIEELLDRSGHLIAPASAFMEKAIQYIVYNWAKNDPVVMSFMDNFLCSLLLSPYLEKAMADSGVSGFIETDRYSPKVRQIIHYAEENFTEPFSLDRLAETIGNNKRYLCAIFRRETGLTIMGYVNHIRIRQATLDMYYHNVPINVAGQRVGFASHSSFSRLFRQLVGISPKEYKSRYALHSESVAHLQDTPRSPDYEELLGVHLLPLDVSIRNLRKLGEY